MGLDYRSREKYFHKDGCNVFCLAGNFHLAHETRNKKQAGVFYTHLRQSPIVKIRRFVWPLCYPFNCGEINDNR